ncbi:aminoacyl-tRNA hydrolase [Lactobacillus xylocopicola]|uniref:Peptidyl-tRNA hydrolase n=1 Tax=Lactobacillus xylocopicola TaxID=2976676 RepID=A0ABN6SKR8_9LACO|nr:aminoacyl-tRNA hydrolase [Lactobacillus xylocopicola]BDR60937.1 peptidyl-tRNA hydrolase [Lactobacillus xylocopicola]
MKIVAGLGNPGKKYDGTKHNTGFMALDRYLTENGIQLDREKFTGKYCKQVINGTPVILLEPLTYMNESGRAVAQFARFFKVAPQDILIIHDDMDMPLGKIRIRANGKSGGHNGIKSIIRDLGSSDFNRLKIGIRHPDNASAAAVVSWVLSRFDQDQQKLMDAAFDTASNVIGDFIAGKSSQDLMNQYN